MAKLSRALQKIFGSTGATTEFGVFGSNSEGAAATTKDPDLIQSLATFLRGLYGSTANATQPPRIQDLNALYYLFSRQIAYGFQAGIPEWLETEKYYANGSAVLGSNGNIYISKTGTDESPNIHNNPVSDEGVNWSIVWSSSNGGVGSDLDAGKVAGTTPGAGGLAALAKSATIWAADNDGPGSGMDADTVDNIQSERIVFGDNDRAATDISNADLDNIVKSGFYSGVNMGHAPNTEWYHVLHIGHTALTYARQIAYGFGYVGNPASAVRTRQKIDGAWSNWMLEWNSANDGEGSGLDADLHDGYQAGNNSGQIPVSNGSVNYNLVAEKSHLTRVLLPGNTYTPGKYLVLTGGLVLPCIFIDGGTVPSDNFYIPMYTL